MIPLLSGCRLAANEVGVLLTASLLCEQERELAHKLDSLFAKGLYSVALNVAEADQVWL